MRLEYIIRIRIGDWGLTIDDELVFEIDYFAARKLLDFEFGVVQ